MERLAKISHNSFRTIGFHKSRSPSSPYGPAPHGSQLITMIMLKHEQEITALTQEVNILKSLHQRSFHEDMNRVKMKFESKSTKNNTNLADSYKDKVSKGQSYCDECDPSFYMALKGILAKNYNYMGRGHINIYTYIYPQTSQLYERIGHLACMI